MKNHFWTQVLATVVALAFSIYYMMTVVPAFVSEPDFWYAVGQGFVNPYASAYAADAIACYVVLACMAIYYRREVRLWWLSLILGLVPGVVVGFAVFFLSKVSGEKESIKNRLSDNEIAS